MSGSMNMSLSGNIYPPSAFYFKVIIGPPAGLTVDTSFQEVSGIDIEMDVETVIEGVKTTLPLHYWITEQPEFVDGSYNIHWLEKKLAERK